jgi:pSer/pThr/pTyr-binding forkhead associated (FHA) protein
MPTSGCLKIIAGAGDEQSISLELLSQKRRLTFGRHRSCDLVLSHPTVSREHFFVEQTGGKWLVVDNSSGNGTFLNSNRISWAELRDGDRIQAGPFVLVAEMLPDSEPPAASTTPESSEPQRAMESVEARDSLHDQFQGLYAWEYIEGVAHFNAGRYFEAHEIWEQIWLRSTGEEKVFYQMLIQAAVGLHHFERSNWTGARGMHRRVTEKLAALPQMYLSLDLVSFARQFNGLFSSLIEDGVEAPQPEIPRPVINISSQP